MILITKPTASLSNSAFTIIAFYIDILSITLLLIITNLLQLEPSQELLDFLFLYIMIVFILCPPFLFCKPLIFIISHNIPEFFSYNSSFSYSFL